MGESATKKKILLIDDDAALRQLYALELSTRGYQAVEASDGQEGLVKAQSEEPDLILLDIMMPKLDGIATLTQIKQDAAISKIPIIMLTNFGQEDLVKQAFSLGAGDYILKYKVTPAEMGDKVKEILATAPSS